MKLVAIAALIAVCGAAKLDRTYLPPPSAATAGGSSDSLQTPLTRTSEQGDSSGNLPSGSFTNSFEGVVVEAAGAGTRASLDGDQSGLGAPRDSYGSQNSKVGDAAFRGSLAGFRNTPFGSPGFNGQVSNIGAGQNFGSFESKSERPQAFKDRNSNIISYSNDVSIDNYSYGFETDNGIAIGENGVANNGIQAQGGYSYQGDDGQVYKVTYIADEGGYRPQGAHLPTPPPIPKEILESLEQNAKDEAAGLVDDGSYDAQKYNAEGDYTHHNSGNIQYNGAQLSQFAKRPESDATASNTFITQSSQAYSKPGQFGNAGVQNNPSSLNDQTNQFGANFVNNQNGLIGSQQQESSQVLSGQKESPSNEYQGSGQFGQSSGGQVTQFGLTQGSQSSQFGTQNEQKAPVSQIGTQSSQFATQTSQTVSPKPQFGGYPSQFGSQTNQQSGFATQFNGQANQGPGSSFVPQPNRPSFGTSSTFNSQQNQFGNQAYKPQGSYGAGEYLPPFSANEKPSYGKPQTDQVSTSEDSNKSSQAPNFVPLGGQTQGFNQISSASSFASVQPQATQVANGFQNKPFGQNQFSFNNGQSNTLPTNTQQSETALGVVPNAKPTSVPSIELTTPLEPNETPKFPQGSQLSSQVNPSSASDNNLGSQSLSNQAEPQTGLQNSFSANQQLTSQTLSPSFADSRPQGSIQFGSTSPAPISFSTTQKPIGNQGRPQYSQSQIQSNNYYSTQKPALSQNIDDSYYYNQPSKPFSTPGARPQGSRFPSTTSYQPNGLLSSQNSQFLNQQGSQPSFNNVPNTGSSVPVEPTPSSQFSQTQSTFSTNGITQASISPFPSVSPTTSTQYNSAQGNQFGSKPNIPSFPSRPVSVFGKNPSSTFGQSQIQFGQNSLSNNNLAPHSQSVPSKPTTFGQTSTSSFTQSQTQLGQSATDSDQSQNPENKQNEGAVSTQTQQYEGTVYEYNKPPEVLPAPEQTDSSSSQSVQTNTESKPHEDHDSNSHDSKPQSQPAQFGQNIFSSQQSSLNQGTKPQSGSQTFSGSQLAQGQNGQNSQENSPGQVNTQPTRPNQSTFLTTSQFSQNQQTGLGSKPQFGSQPAKPFGSVISASQFGQNLQQTTNTNAQPFKPFTGAQTTLQFGQKTQTTFEKQQYKGPQFSTQSNQPFGSAPSQLGQQAVNQGAYGNGAISTQNNQNLQNGQQEFGIAGSVQSAQSSKPFGTSGYQSFQGYPSTKPQFGNQLTLPQFSQSSQQPLGATQISSQGSTDFAPAKPFGSAPAINDSPDSSKPPFDQISQVQQPTQTSGSSYNQYSFQTSQYGSSVPKPQFNAQAQFDKNQNAPIKPFGSAASQAQVGQNTAQASSSAISQPSTVQSYKPFGALFNSNFQSQSKPQFDQAPQSSAVSTTSAPQADVESLGTGAQGSQSQSQVAQSSSVPCCKSINTGSAIGPLNVGKPSQAFAQTQSQFTGFQGAQGFNAQSLAGQGEEFGGPRQPPSFDAQTGYHYRK